MVAPTFFIFTITFAAAAVGTVQVRSLIEPLRKVLARLRGHFIYGKAVDLVMSDRLLEVETVSSSGDSHRIYLP
jgi:NADH dehydrogenase